MGQWAKGKGQREWQGKMQGIGQRGSGVLGAKARAGTQREKERVLFIILRVYKFGGSGAGVEVVGSGAGSFEFKFQSFRLIKLSCLLYFLLQSNFLIGVFLQFIDLH